MTDIIKTSDVPIAEQPTQIHVGPLIAPAPPRARAVAGEESAAATRQVERLLAILLPAALAAPALALPIVWFLVCMFGTLLMAIGARRRGEGGSGTGSVAVAGLSTLADGVRHAFSPPRLIGGLIRLVLFAACAVAITGGWGALSWLIGNGSAGWLVAARLSAYSYAPALASAVVCWSILRAGGAGSQRWELAASRVARTSESAVALATVVCVAITALFVVAVPTDRWAPWSSFDGVVNVLPGQLHRVVLNAEASLVNSEVHGVLTCLTAHGLSDDWVNDDAVRNADGTLSVTITRFNRPPGPFAASDLSTLALSLNNQLPQSVTTIRLHRVARRTLVIGRGQTPLGTPTTNISALVPSAGARGSAFSAWPGVAPTALACSATTA